MVRAMTTKHVTTLLTAAAVAVLISGCAGPRGPYDGMGRFGDDEDDGGPRPPQVQLFVSPSGQPFRAPPGHPYPVADWFAEADADHDGRLTLDEFRADADRWFKALDVNGDGLIDMPEVTRWEEQLVPEVTRGGMGFIGAPRSRNSSDTRTSGAGVWSLVNEPHPIRGADADFSMTVSRAEWRAAADRRFALLDADHDGAITFAELKPTPIQLMMAAAKGKKPMLGRGAPEGGRGPGGRPAPR